MLGEILLVVYVIAGYWATGKTIYANKIVIHKFGELFVQRVIYGVFLGIFLIPWAVIKCIFGKN